MQISVGILGYGNLGKAVKEIILKDSRFKLVAIFTHRSIDKLKGEDKDDKIIYDTYTNMGKYKNRIKILFLCGGSSSTLMQDAKKTLEFFNTIDAFDTHAKIKKHIKDCNKTAKKNKKVAFCSFGWDPGIFSLMRGLFNALGEKTYTVWGKGLSQGHSEAIRRINGVTNAIQFTIPNKEAVELLKSGKETNENLVTRECFVVAKKDMQNDIKQEIVSMPYYFSGYKTRVEFVSEKELKEKLDYSHKGEVFTLNNTFDFSLKTDSNPMLTAKIMVCYSVALFTFLKEGRFGAYSIMDIPLSYLEKDCLKYV